MTSEQAAIISWFLCGIIATGFLIITALHRPKAFLYAMKDGEKAFGAKNTLILIAGLMLVLGPIGAIWTGIGVFTRFYHNRSEEELIRRIKSKEEKRL